MIRHWVCVTLATPSQQQNVKMPLPEVEEILAKYKEKEAQIEDLFKHIEKSDVTNENREESDVKKILSFEEAKKRNQAILKDLETVKGNLRSKAIFSPTEMQWEKICQLYQDEPALPVTTWRCNLPIFV